MAMPTAAAPLAAPPVLNSTDSRRRRGLPLAALCVALVGCAAGSKHDTIPSDGPTMAQIYRQHMAGVGGGRSPGLDGTGWSDVSTAGEHQRVIAGEIDSRFARLPNPDLVMYVAPHLSANGRYPVPGYSTVFPMYETVEYALPGEVPWRRAAAATRSVGTHTTQTEAKPIQPGPEGAMHETRGDVQPQRSGAGL